MLIDLKKLVISSMAVAGVMGQIMTYTLPYVDGDTIVQSLSTNPLGQVVTSTISRIVAGGAATTALTTARTTALTTARTTARTTATTQTTTQRVVGVDTTAPPMRTTTYGYDPGNGVWVTATWTASVTADPAVATAIVPSGTIQDYNSYQTVVNSAVLASAQAAEASIAKATGAAGRSYVPSLGFAAAVGGVVLGAMAL